MCYDGQGISKRRKVNLSPILDEQRNKHEGLVFDGREDHAHEGKRQAKTHEGKRQAKTILIIREKYRNEGRGKHTPTSPFLWKIVEGPND